MCRTAFVFPNSLNPCADRSSFFGLLFVVSFEMMVVRSPAGVFAGVDAVFPFDCLFAPRLVAFDLLRKYSDPDGLLVDCDRSLKGE